MEQSKGDSPLDTRKQAVLHSVITEHIQSAQPVGSSHVLATSGLKVSAATIRNDMSILEDEGYLIQPHTSAGRIPTDKGYRYFVDHLSDQEVPVGTSLGEVAAFFERTHGELELLFKETTQMLSALTDYAALVVVPSHKSCTIKSVQLIHIVDRTAVLVLVLSDGSIEKHTLTLEGQFTESDFQMANQVLEQSHEGTRRDQSHAVKLTGNSRVDQLISLALETIDGTPQDESGESLIVQGASRMALAFDAVDTVRSVLTILEQQILVVNLIRSVIEQDKLTVSIGQEHGLAPLAQCSLVVAPYKMGHDEHGIVGVLGPTRMNYRNAMSAVTAVGDQLEARLSEG